MLRAGFLRGEQQLRLVKVNREVFGRNPTGDLELENWRYATQRVCQSWESKGQLSVIAMIGRIMGCGDRAKRFSVEKEECLALLNLLGGEDADS